jgi:hypothetical protein
MLTCFPPLAGGVLFEVVWSLTTIISFTLQEGKGDDGGDGKGISSISQNVDQLTISYTDLTSSVFTIPTIQSTKTSQNLVFLPSCGHGKQGLRAKKKEKTLKLQHKCIQNSTMIWHTDTIKSTQS